jgi:hypothetical protein
VGAAECAAFRADDPPPSPLRRDLPRPTLSMLAAALKPHRVRRRGSGMGEMGALIEQDDFLSDRGERGNRLVPFARFSSPSGRSLLLSPNLCQFFFVCFFVSFGFFSPSPPAVTPSSLVTLVSVLAASLANNKLSTAYHCHLLFFVFILLLGPFSSFKLNITVRALFYISLVEELKVEIIREALIVIINPAD